MNLQEWESIYSPIKDRILNVTDSAKDYEKLATIYDINVWTVIREGEDLYLIPGKDKIRGLEFVPCKVQHEFEDIKVKLDKPFIEQKNMEQTTGKQETKLTPITSVEKVKEFMLTFKQNVRETPTIPAESEVKFRLKLILEELAEIARDSGASRTFLGLMDDKIFEIKKYLNDRGNKEETVDIKGVLDNLADLRYVADGMAITFGLGSVFDAAFDDVHKANMSKVCDTEEDAKVTVEKYKSENIETYYVPSEGKFLVYRTVDDKALKSHKWKEADLSNYVK